LRAVLPSQTRQKAIDYRRDTAAVINACRSGCNAYGDESKGLNWPAESGRLGIRADRGK
jgi:hypothetical protein